MLFVRLAFLAAGLLLSSISVASIDETAKKIESSAHTFTSKVLRVNMAVNKHIAYQSDIKLHGKKEVWFGAKKSWDLGAGDCEEYVMSKYVMLHKLGVKKENMRMLFVKTKSGVGHVVLLVKKDNNTAYVLDNQTSKVRELKVSFKKMSLLKSVDTIIAKKTQFS